MADPHLHWTLDPGPLAAMAVGTTVYVRRFRAARVEAGGRGAGWPQAAAFAGALLLLLAALVSPLDRLGEDYLFSAHMTQHILLGDLAPLLLLLSLSRVIMRPATRRLTGLERRLGALASPPAFIGLWLVLIYVWHVPALYDGALRHATMHAVEHLCFFVGGVAVWWPLVQPVPMRRRLTGMAPLGYIFAAKVGLAALGIYLAWSTGCENHVQRRAIGDCHRRQDGKAGIAPHQLHLLPYQMNGRFRQSREYFEGAGQIQLSEVRVKQHPNGKRHHRPI